MVGVLMRSREKTVLSLIYARRPEDRLVLLGMKKRGFGAGKYNGFGGKLEPDETLEASVLRELREESGLKATPDDLRWCGTLTYIYDTKPKGMEVHIYDLVRWEGVPAETEEMSPAWFKHEDIPLKSMWADDEFWLVQYLDGDLPIPFGGRFRFKGHEGPDSWVVLESMIVPLQPGPGRQLGRRPEPRPGSAMIVSTVSFLHAPGRCARPLESFIRYHLLKGFALIIIFVDNSSDEGTLDVLRKFPQDRVLTKVRDATLFEEQKVRCSSFLELAPLHGEEVSARQMLDAELAMVLAPEFGCSWVVCLDSDELFFTAEPSVVPHFEALASKGISQMTYLNHEAVPEVVDTDDYFASMTLFRRHHFAVPLSSEARDGLRFWRSRSRRGQYLLFYDNGKSACRTGLGARPKSQHFWRLPSDCRSCTALADPRRMELEGFVACEDPCVLHFPVCGLSWLLAKYRLLGDFPDAWLGGKVKLPASFHGDCRDACSEGPQKLEAMFRREVLLEDGREADRQLAAGVLLRITNHSELLDAVPTRADEGAGFGDSTVTRPVDAVHATDRRDCFANCGSAGPTDAGPQGIELGWILSKTVGYL